MTVLLFYSPELVLDPETEMLIKELIVAAQAADAASAAARASAIVAANASASADLKAATAAADLKAGIAAVGPILTTDAAGNPVVYLPDASDAGYHAISPAPDTTPLPEPAPAPTPTPTPSS